LLKKQLKSKDAKIKRDSAEMSRLNKEVAKLTADFQKLTIRQAAATERAVQLSARSLKGAATKREKALREELAVVQARDPKELQEAGYFHFPDKEAGACLSCSFVETCLMLAFGQE